MSDGFEFKGGGAVCSHWPDNAFERMDESDDSVFYEKDRFVSHLDSCALSTVERIIGRLIVEPNPVILDLMASWDSHIPATLRASRVVGLGLNRNELIRNHRLNEYVVHDLNAVPSLPFPDGSFDVVLNTVSIDYVVKPFDLFAEAVRVLKPGGLFLVIFSNRMFSEKAIKIWRESGEMERVGLVMGLFEATQGFCSPRTFESSGLPRPEDDKYYYTGLPSDPVYAVYADKIGGDVRRPDLADSEAAEASVSARGKQLAASEEAYVCPHCGGELSKWAVPNSPFSTWDTEFLYICFNDECSYLVKGWRTMTRQGNPGKSYRYVHDPVKNSAICIPIVSLHALKHGVVER